MNIKVNPITEKMLIELKADLKANNIKASVRKHKLAFPSLLILPYRKDSFTNEELLKLSDILVNKYHMESNGKSGCAQLSRSLNNLKKLQLFFKDEISYLNPVEIIN